MPETTVPTDMCPNAVAILELKDELYQLAQKIRMLAFDAESNRRACEHGVVAQACSQASEALFNFVNIANVYGESPAAAAAMGAFLNR